LDEVFLHELIFFYPKVNRSGDFLNESVYIA